MIKEQCVSVTDLRTKTKECLNGIDKAPKYIFVNNKPIAVLVDIDEFEEMSKPRLLELGVDQVNESLLVEAHKARKIAKEYLRNI